MAAFNVRWTPNRRLVQDWLDQHHPHSKKKFFIQDIADDTALEPGGVVNIFAWTFGKFEEFYGIQDKLGLLHGGPFQMWNEGKSNFRAQWLRDVVIHIRNPKRVGGGKWVFDPDFQQYEASFKEGGHHCIKSGKRVMVRGNTFHAKFDLTDKTPLEIMGDLQYIEDKMTDGPEVSTCRNCNEFIEAGWSFCHACGHPSTAGN